MKTYMKFLVAIILIIMVPFIILCIDLSIRLKHDAESSSQLVKRLTPGTVEYETYKRWDEDSNLYYEHANKAREYESNDKYDLAIEEYKKSLESKSEKWMAHRHLLDVYEKAEYYDLALQEIDWLLSRKKVDKRIVDELLARKAKILSSSRGAKPGAIPQGDTLADKIF